MVRLHGNTATIFPLCLPMRCSKINRRRTESGLFSLMAMEKPQAGRSQLGINKYYFQRNPSLRRAPASSQRNPSLRCASASSHRNPSLRSAVCIFAAESVAAMRVCIFAAESVAAKRVCIFAAESVAAKPIRPTQPSSPPSCAHLRDCRHT